jgi:PAS domain S-box-containing protein
MHDKGNNARTAAQLRWKAEELARLKDGPGSPLRRPLSVEEAQQTIHELRVHEIELNMQNEELRRVQAELATARARYFDLYDLAPVGYCILSLDGLILEANRTAVALLSLAQATLIKQPITRFILAEDQDIYYLHRKRLFESGTPQACELRMIKRDGTPFWVRLSATPPGSLGDEESTPVSRLVLSDITERKQVEAENARLLAKLQQSQAPRRRGFPKGAGKGGTGTT